MGGGTCMHRRRAWAGLSLTALPVLFVLVEGAIHLMGIPPVAHAFAQLGYPVGTSRALGVIELVSIVLYLMPRTSVLGAILLTGYLGGAVATNLRVGSPLFSNTLFPVYVGILAWGGLFLRDERVRALIPVRR